MHLKQLSKKLVIFGALTIWIIKFFIRPFHLWNDAQFFLGIAPNLFGSFLIPFTAYWLFSGRNYLLARIFRVQSEYDLRIVCLLGLGMLIVNEYLQLISIFGRTFDFNDMIFSTVGLTASYFVFGRIQQRYQPQVG
jgi:hypothetical protein